MSYFKDFKEQSKTSGNLRVRTSRGDLAPTNTVSNLEVSSEETAVVEHPRARIVKEAESNERVGLLFRHWLSLIIGVAIGVTLVIASQVTSKLDSGSTQVETASSINVTVLDPNAAGEASTDPGVAIEESAADTVAAQDEPSRILEHAQARSVQLAERKFLFTMGSGMRSYSPTYVSSDASGQFDFAMGETAQALSLRPLNDSSGRYELGGTSVQWQGNWQAQNPEHNLRLGSAYLDYINRTFGNAVGSNLSAINKEPSRLLNKMPRPQNAPSQIRSYRQSSGDSR